MRTDYLKYFFILVYLFSGASKSINAQDFKSDLLKTQGLYSQSANFYCEINVSVFEKKDSKKPAEKFNVILKKQKENYWYSMGDIEMLYCEKYAIYLNRANKDMIYSIRNSKQTIKMPVPDMIKTIDSLLHNSDSVVYHGVLNGHFKKYSVYTQKSLILKTEVVFDSDTGIISQMIYYYDLKKNAEAEMVVIDYVNSSFSRAFPENDFSENKYIKKSKGGIIPAGNYSGYSISVIDEHDILK